MRDLYLYEQGITLKKEKEAQKKELRSHELRLIIESNERAKINARQREVEFDKNTMQRAIRESEAIRIKEESKKTYAKQMQILQVENMKKINMMK